MYSFHLFKRLSDRVQIDELNQHGVPLNLDYRKGNAEAVLFAYHNFYVELLVDCRSDEILCVSCFRSLHRLTPYLQTIDISEITSLLSYKP